MQRNFDFLGLKEEQTNQKWFEKLYGYITQILLKSQYILMQADAPLSYIGQG